MRVVAAQAADECRTLGVAWLRKGRPRFRPAGRLRWGPAQMGPGSGGGPAQAGGRIKRGPGSSGGPAQAGARLKRGPGSGEGAPGMWAESAAIARCRLAYFDQGAGYRRSGGPQRPSRHQPPQPGLRSHPAHPSHSSQDPFPGSTCSRIRCNCCPAMDHPHQTGPCHPGPTTKINLS
jgi:hypothetical protein